MKSLRTQNYYDILGVASSASSEEIRRAFELSKVTFQENSLATYSLFTDEENQEILGLISRAYETLFNPQLRREYDDFLEGLKMEGGYEGDRVNDFQPKQARQPLQTKIFQPRDPLSGPSFSQPPSQQSSSRQVSIQPARQSRPEQLRTRPPEAGPLRENAPEQLRAEAPEHLRENAPEQLRAEAPGPEPAPLPLSPDSAEIPKNREALDKYLESVTVFNGPVLKKIRELHGLTLENIAEQTKIRRTYLKYLEEEELTFLPAEIYVKGFIVLMARMLDLPADRVSKDYMDTNYKDKSQ
ncbi:MAG: helix-turn-helix domain-containing protein [SAR324 cluster bacterium]|nr:helix-turn-helix domain-containing protein [SAR324 cluster bacterium]